MQNRFKFRAFLKDEAKRNVSKPFIENKIFDVLSIGFDSDNLPETVTLLGYHRNGDFSVYQVDKKDVELIQCTGLKDKNGTLILEGDIVKIRVLEDFEAFEKNEKYIDVIGCIIYEDAGFFIQKNENNIFLGQIPPSELAIIGNIYENPELLEG